MQAIRQQAIVKETGHLEIFSPELPVGTQVEIIILIQAPPLETTPHLLRQTDTSQRLPQGVAGNELLAFAGYIEPDQLQKMSQAIEEDCAKVDLAEITSKRPTDSRK